MIYEYNKSFYKKTAIEIAELVEKKNKDYGNSFEKTISEYGNTAYYLRIDDKLSRLKSLENKKAFCARFMVMLNFQFSLKM